MPSWGIEKLVALIIASGLLCSSCADVSTQQTITVEPPVQEEPVYVGAAIIDTSQVLFAPHPGFVYLNMYLPQAEYDMRYYSSKNFVGDTIDGYHSKNCIASREVAQALKAVQADAQLAGYSLKIFDAYRPQQAVDHFKRWSLQLDDTLTKSEYYPQLQKVSLFQLGYIAEKSQHSRGGAVDLTLVHDSGDQEGEELDMGSPFDFFGGISGWDTQQITAQQMQHRLTLKELMSKHGFRSIKGEWWHYVLRAEPFPDTYFNFPSK